MSATNSKIRTNSESSNGSKRTRGSGTDHSDVEVVENNEKIVSTKKKTKTDKPNTSGPALQQILAAIKDMNNNIKDLTDAVKEVKIEQQNFREWLDTIRHDIKEIREKQENFEGELNVLQQAQKINSFVITGFPAAQTTNASSYEVAKAFFGILGWKTNPEDFEKLFVVQYKNGNGSHIAGTFYDKRIRNMAFDKFRAIKKEKAILCEEVLKHLPPELRGRKLNFRTELTAATRQLLSKVKQHSADFKFIWEKDGRVFVRKTEQEKALEIRSYQQFRAVTGQHDNSNWILQI